MAKYHINNSGVPAICRATTRPCPLGGEHFDSKQEAVEYSQRENKNTFGLLPGMSQEKIPIMLNAKVDEYTLNYQSREESVFWQLDFEEKEYERYARLGEVEALLSSGHTFDEEEEAEYFEAVGNALSEVENGTSKWKTPEDFKEGIMSTIVRPLQLRSARKELARRNGGNPNKYNNYLKTWSREEGMLKNFPADINENETIVTTVLSDGTRRLGVIDEQGEFVLPPVFSKITNGKWVSSNTKDDELAWVAGRLQKGYYFASINNGRDEWDSTHFVVSEKTGKIARLTCSGYNQPWLINGQPLDKESFYEDLENSSYSTLDLEELMPSYDEDNDNEE